MIKATCHKCGYSWESKAVLPITKCSKCFASITLKKFKETPRQKDGVICEDCGVKTKSTHLGKNGFVCGKCLRKKRKIMPGKNKGPAITIDDAVKREYEIKGYLNENGTIGIGVAPSFPQCLIGHKIKISIVPEEEK